MPETPQPAQPILASSLLEAEEKQRRRFSGWGERVRTGCAEIDEYVLGDARRGGGFERGIVLGISAGDADGRLISLNLLTTILLSHVTADTSTKSKDKPATIATVIDSTGSFPLPLLVNILKNRILSSSPPLARPSNEEAASEIVQRCLEMVAISRVFDIEGLWEVLGEVNHEQKPTKETELRGAGTSAKMVEDHFEEGLEIIIVDSMTHIISEFLARKERTEAHNLLTTLSQTLHTITRTLNVLTIIHNTLTTTRSYDSTNAYVNSIYPPLNPKQVQAQRNEAPTSIFSSATQKPSLHQTFSQFTSLHILITKLPRTKGDADLLYEDGVYPLDPDRDGERVAGVDYCSVVEVLKDECPNLGRGKEKRKLGWREQRWCAVVVGKEGFGFVDPFKREAAPGKEGGLGVGDIAKMYGFGGRRG